MKIPILTQDDLRKATQKALMSRMQTQTSSPSPEWSKARGKIGLVNKRKKPVTWWAKERSRAI